MAPFGSPPGAMGLLWEDNALHIPETVQPKGRSGAKGTGAKTDRKAVTSGQSVRYS
jgi:hypothetical protein